MYRSLSSLSWPSWPRPLTPRLLAAWFTAGLLIAGLAVAVTGLWHLSRRFPEAPLPQPSRLYGRVPELAVGAPCRLAELAGRLASQGYVPAAGQKSPRQGSFELRGDTLAVGLRVFPTPAGWGGGRPLRVEVRTGRVARLLLAGREVAREPTPERLASFAACRRRLPWEKGAGDGGMPDLRATGSGRLGRSWTPGSPTARARRASRTAGRR